MLPLANDCFENLQPYVPGKPVSETERELGLTGCIKLASNENPLGPSPKAVAAMQQALGSVHDYPDGGGYYLKQRLAAHVGVASEQILLGNGSNELVEMMVRTFLRPGENFLFAHPSFIAYKLCAAAAGAQIRTVALRQMRFDLPALAAAMDERTKLLFIANPNNPTGTYVNRQELTHFLASIRPDVVVGLDEAYIEYVDAADFPNGVTLLAQHPRLVVLRTFSKCYGLAGVRVGYGVAAPELIDYLNRGRQPFNVNALGQAAALAALDDEEHVQKTVQLNRAERQYLSHELAGRGVVVTPSQANFLLGDFGCDASALFAALLRQGVIVRPMGGYGLATSLRVTVGTPEQNRRFLTALDRAAPQLGRSAQGSACV